MVLLVVDTQKLLVNSKLYNFENFITNIRELINTSRKNNIEVLYVIHDDGVESDLTKGKDGFEVYEEFKPMEQEKVFVKNVNSFHVLFSSPRQIQVLVLNMDLI